MNPRRLVYGVGINDSNYVTQQSVSGRKVICPFFQRWKNMLERCYSKKYLDKHPSYNGCTVCEEWKRFSIFKVWMEKQDWEGKDLDKDTMFIGNKVYSPETCVFIPRRINTILGSRSKLRGDYPLGVHKRKPGKDMVNDYTKPFVSEGFRNGKRSLLGVFASIKEAHRAWQISKIIAIRFAVLEWELCNDFNEQVATSLIELASKIEEDWKSGKETTSYA